MPSVIFKITLLIACVSIFVCGYVIRTTELSHYLYSMKIQRPISCNDSYSMITSRPYKQAMFQNGRKLWWSGVGGLKDTPLRDLDRQDFFKYYLNRTKVILRVGNETFPYTGWRDGSSVARYCPITSCVFTSNRSSFKTADALIISEFSEAEFKFFTPKPKGQIWITHFLEPPHHNRIKASLLNGLVNWTADYRLDSTFSMIAYLWSKIDQSQEYTMETKSNYAQGKTKKVAMFVSNCNAISGRIAYATELNETISVDIYGRCGSKTCSRKNGTQCFKMLRDDYKFYLSFENSNCPHYITEKLHGNALGNDVIPIVMGARKEDYAFVAPPGSYIHVDDFESPRHLGEYLNLLDKNDTLYNEYFQYKRRFSRVMPPERNSVTWCQICVRLHLIDYLNLPKTWHDDYEKWGKGSCATQNDGDNSWKTWKTTTQNRVQN